MGVKHGCVQLELAHNEKKTKIYKKEQNKKNASVHEVWSKLISM